MAQLSFAQNKTDSYQQHIIKNTNKIYSAFIADTSIFGSVDIQVSATDTSGTQLWSNYIGGDGLELVKGIAFISNYILVYGTTRSSSIGLDDNFIVTIDTSGNIVDQIIFGTPGQDKITELIQQSTSLMYIGNGGPEAIIGSLAFNNGFLSLDTTLTISSSQNLYLEDLSIDESINHYVTGYSDTLAGSQKDMIWIKLDSNFTSISATTIGNNGDQQANKIIVNKSQSVIAGYTQEGGAYQNSVLSLNSTGGIVWQKSFGTFLNEKTNELRNISNKIYVGGYTQSTSGSYDDAFITTIDTNGNITNQIRIDLPHDEYATRLKAEDNKITVTGPFKFFSQTNWGYFSIDLDSNLNGCQSVKWNIDTGVTNFTSTSISISTTPFSMTLDTTLLKHSPAINDPEHYICNLFIQDSNDTSSNEILASKSIGSSIYPNPFTDYLTVETPVISQIKVENCFGQVVMKKSANVGKHNLNLSHLNDGIYVIYLTNNGSQQVQKMIKSSSSSF